VITDYTTGAGTTTLTVNLALGDFIYGGTINDSSTRKIDLIKSGSGTQEFSAISLKGNVTLSASGGTAIFSSLSCGTLTIGNGAVVVISPLPGGPTAGGSLEPLSSGNLAPVPEPGGITMLLMTLVAFGFYGLRRYRSSNIRKLGGA
jgi:hypothetical protein